MASTARHDPRVALLKELADPLRLRVVDRLGHRGPAGVTLLAAELDVPLPQLSNHLRRLREAGLLQVERTGRHAVYSLADPGLEQLMPLLDRITGRIAEPAVESDSDYARARSCYDHLAGRLGVELYRSLIEQGAVEAHADGSVGLGPRAAEVLAGLGLDAAAVDPGRRRFAFECLDATQHAPHLAGALGDAVAAALVAQGWIERVDDGRTIHVSAPGRAALRERLGLELPRDG